jgi:hypothetical protein
MFLFGEVCPTWRCGVGSSKYQPDHWFTKSRRTGGLPPGASETGSETTGGRSALRSNPRRDRAEVSRGHSSRGTGDGAAAKGRT